MTAALALVRAIHFASLMVLFGADGLNALLRDRSGERAARLLAWLAVAALVSAVLWLVIVCTQISAEVGAVSLWNVATETLFGRVFLVRIVVLAVLASAAFFETATILRLALAGAALASLSLTSHAAAGGAAAFMLARAAVDAVHLLAAAFWVGGLTVLLPLAVAKHKTPAVLIEPLMVFSRWATASVALLIAAGALNAYLILSGGQGSWSAGYLTLLALKIVLAGLMVALALTNRLHLLPGLRQEEAETSRQDLVMMMTGELILGLVIVLIVGFLGTMSPWMA